MCAVWLLCVAIVASFAVDVGVLAEQIIRKKNSSLSSHEITVGLKSDLCKAYSGRIMALAFHKTIVKDLLQDDGLLVIGNCFAFSLRLASRKTMSCSSDKSIITLFRCWDGPTPDPS